MDVTPKNLGTIDLDDLLEDLEFDVGGSSSTTWGIPTERSQRSIAPLVAIGGAGEKSSMSSRFSVNQSDMDDIMNQVRKRVEGCFISLLGNETAAKICKKQRLRPQMSTINMDRETSTRHAQPLTSTSTTTSIGSYDASLSVYSAQQAPPSALPPFIKIIVRETDDIELYSANSHTVPQDSAEAAAVIEDNKRYDYLTIGKGRARRTSEAEAQTPSTLYKSRAINTDRVRRQNVASYVSNFDMFDTYAELEKSTTTLDADDVQIAMTTYKGGGVGDDEEAMLA